MSNKKNKGLRIFLGIILAMVVITGSFTVYLAIIAIDHPPIVKDLSPLDRERIREGDTYRVGNNWLRKSESGLWEAYVEGQPFERGVAFGKLTKELLYYQETSFVEQIKELVPSEGYLKLLKYFISFFNRNLDKNIPYEYKQEIYGTSFACSSEYSFIGTGYQRQLNYHAAHDIGHALQDLNLAGCTSFSVWDSKSKDSSLLIGRNFDFYMGDKFAKNKIVCFVNPMEGYKFMMVTWADMIGVVSGMNERGLTVTINASKSTIPTRSATPVTILAREILQYARTIQEAYEISKRRSLFVSESILIGSDLDGKTAIIEKSPDNEDVVMSDLNYIICANHFQGKAFESDKINQENIVGSDSPDRYARVEELVNGKTQLDVDDIVSVLRDQKAVGGVNAGMGNQVLINQLIAHHSVVFKPDSLLVWVSTSPWQLGKYVAYDLKKVFKIKPEDINDSTEIYEASLTILPDTFLQTKKFEGFLKYRRMTKDLKLFTKNDDPLPDGFADEYIKTNPELYLTYCQLGDYFQEIGDYNRAFSLYSVALTKKLPGKNEEDKIRNTMNKIKRKQ